MKWQIRTNEIGKSFVTPVDGPQAGETWQLTFTSPEHAREAILTVSRMGKPQPPMHPLLAYGQAVQEQRLIPDYAID